MARTRTLLKWHGGKSDLAAKYWDTLLATTDWPIHVVEPYCGGASFTLDGLARGLQLSFVVNDLSRKLMNFWRTIREPDAFAEFARAMQATPFSEVEFVVAGESCGCCCGDDLVFVTGPCVRCACEFFIRNRQSLAGRMKDFTGVTKTRTRRGMNNEVSAWLSVVDDLPWFHALLRQVLVLDARPGVEVIRKHDTPQTLFLCDPPYLFETRSTTGEYEHEMTVEQHHELLDTLSKIKGRFLLCGYDSSLYAAFTADHGWTRHDFPINNHAAGGKTKKIMTEYLWTKP